MSASVYLPAALLLAGLAAPVLAQVSPADPAVPVPALQYHSVFSAPVAASPQTGWRQANDAVRDAGGHAAVLKDDAGQGQAAPSASGMMPMHQPQMHQPQMRPQMHQHREMRP